MTSVLTSQLVVRLIDQVTGPARTVGRSLLGLNRAANGASGSFGGRLGAAIERNNRALDQTCGRTPSKPVRSMPCGSLALSAAGAHWKR